MDVHYWIVYCFFCALAAAASFAAFPSLRSRCIVVLTDRADGVLSCHAPPASALWHLLHFHTLTASLRMASLPQNGHTYVAAEDSHNFFAIFLRAAPYLVPYFPMMPNFLVLLPINGIFNVNKLRSLLSFSNYLISIWIQEITTTNQQYWISMK